MKTFKLTIVFLFVSISSSLAQNVDILGNAKITGSIEVMDTIHFADGTDLASACLKMLQDTDGDTKIEVESNPDDDIIRFYSKGVQIAYLDGNRLSINNGGNSIHLGINAGNSNSTGNNNVIIGNGAGSNNNTGSDNVIIGNEANSEEPGSRNVYIGRESGFNILGDGNVYIGYKSGMNIYGSNQLVIENSESTSPLLYGSFLYNKLALNGTQMLGSANMTIHDTDGGYGGIYVNSLAGGLPFYGYAQGGVVKAWEYIDANDNYRMQKGGTAFLIDSQNNFGIGTISPENKLHVLNSNPTGHVVKIENSNSGSNADGLEIKLGAAVTGQNNHYITFNDANSLAGRIEGFSVNEPNFTNFPGIDLSAYFDLIHLENIVFDPGSLPYPNLSTLQLPSATFSPGQAGTIQDNSSFDAGAFISNVLCITNPLCNHTLPGALDPVVNFDVTFAGWQPASLNFDPGQFPTWVPGSLPELDISAILDPNIRTTAYADLQTLANWAIQNGIELFTALDPWINQYLQDPEYWNNIALAKHGGVTYGSKGADYAEWLEKEDITQNFKAGQIVGVKNGKISLDTEDADQIMAISVMPVVLGNLPDSTRIEDYEKIAFIGQTPVWVVGDVESGDFIIASGLNDGFGLAVSEEELTLDQVSKVVGRAWEDADKLVNLVNVAVGLKSSEMAGIMKKFSIEMDGFNNRLSMIEAQLGITQK